jgi:hypothetical protein
MGKDQDADRGFIYWKPQKQSIPFIKELLTVIHYYRDRGYPAPTPRDVNYDMIGWYGHKKGDALTRKLYRLLRKMRRVSSGPGLEYKIPFDAITDDTPTSLVATTYTDPANFWSKVKGDAGSYYKDLTQSQPRRVIVYTEGAGAVQQLHHVAQDYAIPVWSPGGWDQLDLKHSTAARAVSQYRRTGRETTILHTGDFDPDGVELFEVFTEDVHAFIAGFGEDPSILTFKRVMLTPEQVEQLPPEKRSPIDPEEIKVKNYRGQKWPLPYKVELQALNLEERLEVLREAIEAELDLHQLREDREAHEAEYEDVNTRAEKILEELEDW